jgi:hypothetical protein
LVVETQVSIRENVRTLGINNMSSITVAIVSLLVLTSISMLSEVEAKNVTAILEVNAESVLEAADRVSVTYMMHGLQSMEKDTEMEATMT